MTTGQALRNFFSETSRDVLIRLLTPRDGFGATPAFDAGIMPSDTASVSYRYHRAEHPIRAILVVRRITQKDFAKAIDYSRAYVQSVVNGRSPPSEEFVNRASKFLDLPPKELFVGVEEDINPS